MKKIILAALCLLLGIASISAQLNTGIAESFNSGWLFALESDSIAPAAADYYDSGWRRLDLPHDWSIEALPSPYLNSCTGFFPGGKGWYRKHFTITDPAAVTYLCFEGVYNRSEVFVNGTCVGGRPNGYVTFFFDITRYLTEGENVIAVKVDHTREADSRWYSGSGIYRDTWLIHADDTHFVPWSLYWQASSITPDEAVVEVDFGTCSSTNASLTATATLTDASGARVASKRLKVAAGSIGHISLKINNPRLWDIDNPNLYDLHVELWQGRHRVDSTGCRVGLRTLSFDPDHGMYLNGRNIKVKGVCLHHDAGVLGAVVPPEVWRRKLLALKAIGVNAIRLSHNPQAPVVYDLCDQLGLLVMDEASDEWEYPKRKWVTGWNVGTPKFEGSFDFFEEWIERDVADMVLRDRNHPCVAFWSIGNEVDYPNDPYSHPVLDRNGALNQPTFGGYKPEAPSAMRIGEIAQRLAPIVRALDATRPVTGALAGVVMSNETAYPEAVDIVGYNYTEDRYEIDHQTYPDRIIYGSENGHSYDAWLAVRDNEHIFGQFLWTGTDYLGESGVWPSRGLGTGLLDFGSYLKPRGKFRASLWLDTPVAFLGTLPGVAEASIDAPDIWNYTEGDTVTVMCYTNCPSARLSINGEALGTPIARDERTGMVVATTTFRPGALSVEALDATGNVVAVDTLYTVGQPAELRLRRVDAAEGDSVAMVEVEVVDATGHRIPQADTLISCTITGGTLLGLEGTGNTDMSDPRATARRACNGRILAYIRLNGSQATVSFTAPLLPTATLPL